MTSKKDPKSPTKEEYWASLQRYPTERGVTTRIKDNEAYLRALAEVNADEILAALQREGIDLGNVVIYRLFVRGRADMRRFAAAIRALTADGKKFSLAQCRLSGSENQKDGASGPGQERDGVLHALRLGATRILVVCEAFSAAAGSERAVFPQLLECIRQRMIEHWIVASLDRVSRAPKDCIAFCEAAHASGMAIHSPQLKGRIDAYQALMTMIMLLMGSLQVIAIRAGNARGWATRVSEGRWPNPGNVLPGMRLDSDKRPHFTEEARAALAMLLRLVGGGMPLAEALAAVEREHAHWWVGDNDAPDERPSIARVTSLLRLTALVDGKQAFSYREQTLDAQLPGLANVTDRETFDAVQRALLPTATSTRAKTGAFARCFGELRELGIPVHIIVEDSEGAIDYDTAGNLRIACRHCAKNGIDPTPAMAESDAFYTDLQLVNGKMRRGYAVPVFACEHCGRTTRPISVALLGQLLSGHPKLCCPRCRSTRLGVHKDSLDERMALVHCARCDLEFRFDMRLATPEERFRFFLWKQKQPRDAPRAEADLRSFKEPDEDEGGVVS